MSEIVNYDDIRQSLELILEESSELDSDEVSWILNSLDDSVSNNLNSLVLHGDKVDSSLNEIVSISSLLADLDGYGDLADRLGNQADTIRNELNQ